MSLYPQTLSQDHLNLLRNELIKFEFSPLVFHTIIKWGCEKPDDVTIKKHIENQKIEEKSVIKLRDLKMLFKKHEEKVNMKDFSSYDVTFLYDILPVLCYDKVSQNYGEEWKDKIKDTNSIEYLLQEIKNFRNDVSHEYSKAKDDPNIEAKKKLMKKCIKIAGTLYGKDQREIDKKVEDLEAKFDELVYDTTSSYENAVRYVIKSVEKKSAHFMQHQNSELFSVPLPSGLTKDQKVDTAQIIESLNLSVADKVKGDSKKTFFCSNEICTYIKNKFVVINGGQGSGKTTLLRNLYINILDNSVNRSELSYEGISRFKVPIYLECRTERHNNLLDFLKESIPKSCSPKDVIYDAFKEVNGLVFLIDGYDEVSNDCKKLVDEIIQFCRKNNATCIVSGRVDAVHNLIKILQDTNLNCDEMLIEPINEKSDKLSFLKRYGEMMGDDVDTDELVKSFKNLKDTVQEVFYSPVLLALFISLFLNNRNCLSQLHNEQSAYKAIRKIYFQEIEKKLRKSNVPNPRLRTKDILAVFSYYSLLLFRRKEYFFKEDDYDNLVRDCEQVLSKDYDFEKLLTCILTPETSLKQGNSLTFAFTHSTIQEYLAIEQITKNMKDRYIDWNSKQISENGLLENFLECLGVSTTNTRVKTEVERYGNIIKLLILETLANIDIEKYTKSFTAVLKKYFTPKWCRPLDYLLDLVISSNYDTAISSIVSNVMGDESYYQLAYTRHIRPLTEVLRKRKTSVDIKFSFSGSFTDTDCANFGQLVSVFKDGSEIMLYFNNSYCTYKPLNGEFYTQLKNCRCKVIAFRACVTSTEHLSIVMRVWGSWSGNSFRNLLIRTVPSCNFTFDTLEETEIELKLRVEYTDDYLSIGSNPFVGRTHLLITDTPADGRENVFNIIMVLSPKSNEYGSIELVNCLLTDTDIIELLKKLESEKIRTLGGKTTELKETRVNTDKSRNLSLLLPDIEKKEAKQQEAAEGEAKQQEAEHREAAQ